MNVPPLIDTHCDFVIPLQELRKKFLTQKTNTQTSLPLLRKVNAKILFAGFSYDDLLKNSNEQLDDILRLISENPETFELITDYSQVDRIFSSDKIGILLHIEGAGILEGDIKKLDQLYEKGIRCLGFTHNTKNSLGQGALVGNDEGLTDFGKQVLKRCNELKIIVDTAHLNEKGFYDVLNLSSLPLIVTHGNAYSITPSPRNFKDAQLKELAKLDSVIGVFFSGKFLNPEVDPQKASIEDAILHIDHIVKVAGIDHVCIGSDFGGITSGLPKGMEDHTSLLNLYQMLKENGYSEKDLEKITYKNILRVLKEYGKS